MIGIEPIARAYRVRTTLRFPNPRGRSIPIDPQLLNRLPLEMMELRFYRRPSNEELASVMKSVRARMKGPRKDFSEKSLWLYKFFKEYGEPPAKGKMKFWDKAFSEWKREHPAAGIRSADSLRVAKERLDRLLLRSYKSSSPLAPPPAPQ
ncbi:MAG: hypothetical protein ABFD52_05730 [Acidobacteriota bacterium]